MMIILVIFIAFSCDNNDSIPNEQPIIKAVSETKNNLKMEDLATINYELTDGRIALDTEEDFIALINGLQDMNLNDWEQSIGHVSYRTMTNLDDVIQSNQNENNETIFTARELATIMNSNGVLQVGDYIFKLIPDTRKVLTLDLENITNIDLLNNATEGNDLITEFSFDDDIFELLSNANEANSRAICNEPQARGKHDLDNVSYTCEDESRYGRTEVRYQDFGLYHRLSIFFQNSAFLVPYINVNRVDFEYVYDLRYRCGSNFTRTNHVAYTNCPVATHIVYSGSRSLKRSSNSIKVKSYFKTTCGSTHYIPDITLLF